ncbi:MAG: phosphatase PAP2 family protein [Candidatus Sericytochromatia bacterium]
MLSNLKHYLITQSIVATFYYLVKQLTPFKPIELQLTSIDLFIKPHPAAVWIYMSFFFLFMSGVVFSSKEDSIRCCKIILINSVIASIFFILLPTTIIFDNYEPYLQKGTISYDFMYLIKKNDDTYNCFPSLHIANSIIATVFLVKKKKPLIQFLSISWLILVIWSVISTKQHLFYDVIGGALVAFASYSIIKNYEKKKKLDSIESA